MRHWSETMGQGYGTSSIGGVGSLGNRAADTGLRSKPLPPKVEVETIDKDKLSVQVKVMARQVLRLNIPVIGASLSTVKSLASIDLCVVSLPTLRKWAKRFSEHLENNK